MSKIVHLFKQTVASILVYVFVKASSKQCFRRMLKYVPWPVLRFGYNKVAMKSIDQSSLIRTNEGSIAFITQSGAVEYIILNMMARERLGLSELFLYDHRTDTNNLVEILKGLAHNPKTKAIMLYVEAIKQGRRLINTAGKITRKKPIIVLKAGRSKAGARAVLCHTSSLAGSDRICNAAFRQFGMLRVQTTEELLDFARALSLQPPAKGSKVAVISNGGGAGIVAADSCVNRGLVVPELSKRTQERLEKEVLPFSCVSNPVDITTAANVNNYATTLDILLKSSEVDVIILFVFQAPTLRIEKLVDAVLELRRANPKPIVVSGIGDDKFIEYLYEFEKAGVPLYLTPERAAAGALALAHYGQYINRSHDTV